MILAHSFTVHIMIYELGHVKYINFDTIFPIYNHGKHLRFVHRVLFHPFKHIYHLCSRFAR